MSASSLYFNDGSGRWCVGERELHCGDGFKLFPDRDGLPAIDVRIEHSQSIGGWYLITPYGLTQLSKRKALL